VTRLVAWQHGPGHRLMTWQLVARLRHRRREVIPIRERLGVLRFRLFGRCFVCNRPMALHTPRRLNRCHTTPLPLAITVRGWLLARGLDPPAVDAWCQANGVDPGAIVQPVVPVSMHAHSA
jgi:hypothetical protein